MTKWQWEKNTITIKDYFLKENKDKEIKYWSFFKMRWIVLIIEKTHTEHKQISIYVNIWSFTPWKTNNCYEEKQEITD